MDENEKWQTEGRICGAVVQTKTDYIMCVAYAHQILLHFQSYVQSYAAKASSKCDFLNACVTRTPCVNVNILVRAFGYRCRNCTVTYRCMVSLFSARIFISFTAIFPVISFCCLIKRTAKDHSQFYFFNDKIIRSL